MEDQDVFRKHLRCLLEEEGFEVADAPNAQARLECVARFRPDIVLMDVNLPEEIVIIDDKDPNGSP